jgi:endo-1,4-beta-xylanase
VPDVPTQATLVPTQTEIPSTNTPLPPTTAPTPAPDNIADAKNLSTWIANYVNAFGGKVTVNGVEMDAAQLLNEIKANPDSFTQVKQVDGVGFSFLVVDDFPLAILENKKWRALGLKDLIGYRIEIGVTLTGDLLENSSYWDIVNSNFNQITVEEGFHWKWLEPQKGNYDNYQLTFIKKQIERSKSQNTSFVLRGHPVLFAQNNPEWLSTLSKDEAIQSLEFHVSDVIKRFPQMQEWVVVNEPYLSAPQYNYTRADSLHQTIGIDYLEIAFRAARESNPTARLIYNDTLNHSSLSDINSMTTKLTRENIASLIQNSLIDGLGMEMHIDASKAPAIDDMVTTMDSYGLPIYITELDVDISSLNGSEEEKNLIQADVFANVLEACLKAKQCAAFSFWNIGDKYSWYEKYMSKPNANATPFDDNLKPKPAFYSMLQVLYQTLP